MTNLFETKTPPTFDSISTVAHAAHEASGVNAQDLAGKHLTRFRDAVKDEIVDREMTRETMEGSAAMAMVGLFTKASNTKREYGKSLGDLSKYYLVDALLNLFADETLVADIMTGEIVQLQGRTKDIDDELQVLQRRLNIDQLMEDITLDLLKQGDYTLRMKVEKGVGVHSVLDDVNQGNIVAMYRHGLPEKFLIREKSRLRILSASTHLHFALGRSKLRIDLGDEFQLSDTDREKLADKLPTYIRVGRPLLYGTESKLKELQLLEALVPASKLHQLSTGSLVGVSVPSQTDPKEAFAISRRYESLLNSKTSLDKRTGTMTDVGDILSTAGRAKVVPVMGEKGNLQSIDVKENRVADDMLSSIRDIRSTICSTIGVPPELLFGSESPESKGEFLKRHARYLRKVKSIQSALANGLKQLALAHLIAMGYEVMPNDIQVVFRNEVVNIDELDKLEFADQVNAMVSDLWAFMVELNDSDQFQGRIDFEALSEWMRRQMALMGSNRSFIKPMDEALHESSVHDPMPKKKTFRPKLVGTEEAGDEVTEAKAMPDEVFMAALRQLAEKKMQQQEFSVAPPVEDDPREEATEATPAQEAPGKETTSEQAPTHETAKPTQEALVVIDESAEKTTAEEPAPAPQSKPRAKRKFKAARRRSSDKSTTEKKDKNQ